jgi:hypothetical protein
MAAAHADDAPQANKLMPALKQQPAAAEGDAADSGSGGAAAGASANGGSATPPPPQAAAAADGGNADSGSSGSGSGGGDAVDEDALAGCVAHFLRVCPGLSKVTIGELLGDPKPFYLKVSFSHACVDECPGGLLQRTCSSRAMALLAALSSTQRAHATRPHSAHTHMHARTHTHGDRSWRRSRLRLTSGASRLTLGCGCSWKASSCRARRRRSTASSTVRARRCGGGGVARVCRVSYGRNGAVGCARLARQAS